MSTVRLPLGGRPDNSEGYIPLESELVAHLKACKLSATQVLALVCVESISDTAGYRSNRTLLKEFLPGAYQKQNKTKRKVTPIKFFLQPFHLLVHQHFFATKVRNEPVCFVICTSSCVLLPCHAQLVSEALQEHLCSHSSCCKQGKKVDLATWTREYFQLDAKSLQDKFAGYIQLLSEAHIACAPPQGVGASCSLLTDYTAEVVRTWVQNLLNDQLASISVDDAGQKSEAVAAAFVSAFTAGTQQHLQRWEASTSTDSLVRFLAALGLQAPFAYADWESALICTAATQSSRSPTAPTELFNGVVALKEVWIASMTAMAMEDL